MLEITPFGLISGAPNNFLGGGLKTHRNQPGDGAEYNTGTLIYNFSELNPTKLYFDIFHRHIDIQIAADFF